MLPVLVVAAAGSGAAFVGTRRRRRRLLSSKPQRRFKVVLADNTCRPFQHLQLPHASPGSNAEHMPASKDLTADKQDSSTDTTQHQQQEQHQQQAEHHPYAAQIAAILQHPKCPNFFSTTATTAGSYSQQQQPPPALADTPLVWVNTPKRLQQMLADLQGVKCLALDTEHNSQRSYLGVLCLLQLSTGTVDYLVDALVLHDQLHLLRPVMADPAVLKVLHGGANDIAWLQRDAHVYLVNVFDTEKAAQALGREERSLAHLLRRYCGVAQNKAHQTADWRLRPLTPELQQYARSDVHWLIYLAGLMVAEMQARSPSTTGNPLAPGPFLTSALQKSNTQTLRLYHKTPAAVTISNGTAAAMRRYLHAHQQLQQQSVLAAGRGLPVVAAAVTEAAAGGASSNSSINSPAGALDELQLMVVRQRLAALVAWRDAAARADDEGPQYTLPDAALLELVRQPPTTAKQLLAVVEQHTRNLNDAVQHLPAAPRWAVSAAVKKSAKQLVLLLQGTSAATTDSSTEQQGLGAPTGAAAAAAAAGAGAAGEAAASGQPQAAGGLPLMVGGQLVGRFDLQGGVQQQPEGGGVQKRKKKDKANGELRERMIKKFSAKTQVYDNCRMLSTTGELLCYCDARKLNWYLDKGLAELVVDEPPTIRLLFEHKNADQQMGLDGFYSTSRANRCVVCGCEEHYLRYRVVPACYRRCFPQHLKSHRSHDIVLLCVDCHQVAHKAAERVKRDVAAQYNIPLQPTYQHLQQMQEQQTANKAALPATQQPPQLDAADDGSNDGDESDSGSSRSSSTGDEAPAANGTAAPSAMNGSRAAAAAADTAAEQVEDLGDGDVDDDINGGDECSDFLSTYHRGVPQPVSGVLLAHQARAAAVALVRFGDNIPTARRRQLEGLVARFVGREVMAADLAGDTPLVTAREVEAALLAGLGDRKRAKTLKKLRKNLKQMHEAEEAPMSAGQGQEEDGPAAASVAASGQQGCCTNGDDPGSAVAKQYQRQPSSTNGSGADSSRLEQLLAQQGRRPDEQGHLWHGQQVVEAALARGGEEELQQLVQRFRQVFVVACSPKFLPANWAVNAVDTREFGAYSVYAKDVEEGNGAEAVAEAAASGEEGLEDEQQEQQQQQSSDGRAGGLVHVDDGLSIFAHSSKRERVL